MVGVGFYDQVLRELLAALGGALFVGNLLALLRRRRDGDPGERRSGTRRRGTDTEVRSAPTVRTVTYMLLGFVVMVWGVVSLIAAA